MIEIQMMGNGWAFLCDLVPDSLYQAVKTVVADVESKPLTINDHKNSKQWLEWRCIVIL